MVPAFPQQQQQQPTPNSGVIVHILLNSRARGQSRRTDPCCGQARESSINKDPCLSPQQSPNNPPPVHHQSTTPNTGDNAPTPPSPGIAIRLRWLVHPQSSQPARQQSPSSSAESQLSQQGLKQQVPSSQHKHTHPGPVHVPAAPCCASSRLTSSRLRLPSPVLLLCVSASASETRS